MSRKSGRTNRHDRFDFAIINQRSLAILPSLLPRWLPGGRVVGTEYLGLNPHRSDHHLGSFRINLRTGRWADFALDGARGGDAVSLFAYITGIGQVEAARRLAVMLGVVSGGGYVL
jgi:hypothetical protein